MRWYNDGLPSEPRRNPLRASLEARHEPIDSNDLPIDAHAYTTSATIVTANADGFERIRGLNVENRLT